MAGSGKARAERQKGRKAIMGKVYTGGIPYALDVKRLMEAFPLEKLEEGSTISHESLVGVLNLAQGSPRYYGVIDSWVRKMRNETGVFMVWAHGDGLTVLSPTGLLGHAETRTRQKIRQTKRAIGIFGWVQQRRDRLNETGKARLDHQIRIANALKAAADSTMKELACELAPVISLPRKKIG